MLDGLDLPDLDAVDAHARTAGDELARVGDLDLDEFAAGADERDALRHGDHKEGGEHEEGGDAEGPGPGTMASGHRVKARGKPAHRSGSGVTQRGRSFA